MHNKEAVKKDNTKYHNQNCAIFSILKNDKNTSVVLASKRNNCHYKTSNALTTAS